MVCQGFVVMLNSIGSDAWPGGGDVVWYQGPSAVTKEGSSQYEELWSASAMMMINKGTHETGNDAIEKLPDACAKVLYSICF